MNIDCLYPIRGVPGICFRTAANGCQPTATFRDILRKERFINSLISIAAKRQIIFVDNVETHSLSSEAEARLPAGGIDLKFLSTYSTHLMKLADAFSIASFRRSFLKYWKQFKIELIKKRFFLQNLKNV